MRLVNPMNINQCLTSVTVEAVPWSIVPIQPTTITITSATTYVSLLHLMPYISYCLFYPGHHPEVSGYHSLVLAL